MTSREVHLDALLGRMVVTRNNRPVGRLEEFHAEPHGDDYRVVEFVIGSAGLLERLHVGVRALFGLAGRGRVARWDQLDISDPEHPRLTCPPEELSPLEP